MAKKITVCAMLTAICMAFSYIESQISLPFAPGVKLGLANAVVLLLFTKGFIKEGIAVNLARILLSSFLFAGVFSLIFSCAAAAVSSFSVICFKRFKCFSPAGLSIIGATLHNFTQVLVCVFVYKSVAVFTYLPILCALGAVTGLLTGLAVIYLEKRLKNIF